MKTKTYIANSIVVLLLVLWIPIGLYQVMHFEAFKSGILQQPFGYSLCWSVIYTLPALELLTAALLVFDRSRKTGLLLSCSLLLFFTGYIALVLLGVWGKPPCNCGLAIPSMGWMKHLWFNLFFLGVSISGYILHFKLNKSKQHTHANSVAAQRVF